MTRRPNTRDRILQASLQLFNEQGERNVTTNHIASHMGISPGNLYYHFRSKSEIVAELFAGFQQQMEAFFTIPADEPLTLEDKARYLENLLEILWQHRFMHQGLEYLLEADPALAEGYRQFAQRTLAGSTGIYLAFAEAGILELTPRQAETLSINVWIVLSGWLQFLTTSHGLHPGRDRRMLQRGIYQILALEEGYVAPAYREAVRELRDRLHVPLEDLSDAAGATQ